MKRILIIVLLVSFFTKGHTQNKGQKVFRMPSNVEYHKGRVLVKIKEEHRQTIVQMSQQTKVAQVKNVTVNSLHSLVKPELDRQGAMKMGMRTANPNVDISKYYTLTFSKNENVEEYINQLYATGYFEIVEPDYKYKTSVTPNDISISSQYYLSVIKAFDAWDISKADTTMVIAIVDSGGNLTHPDLVGNLYRNWKEYPANGVDDDGNGYIDDFQGWDFMGTDTLNVTNPDFIGDNNPTVTKGGLISHGTWAAGCASASTNNGKGIAGVGYKARLLFTKHSADNQKTTDGSVNNPWIGMLYAANQGDVKIINCSFGGPGRSQIIQDLINYIVLDRNCLVVAAAGNENTSAPSYPGAYDNVLSVAATDQNDFRASFTNYGTTVDLSAPGVGIYTTGYNGVYNTVDGTSFSSPITAGAAALVWAKNPTFTAVQVGEQLRVSADPSFYDLNSGFVNQMGKGRLDIKRALTLELPSVRAGNPKLVNQNGFAALPGEKAYLSFDFKNYLKSTSGGIQITISPMSLGVTISKNTVTPGIIPGGGSVSNKLTPFELTINSNVAPNTLINLLITYSDGAYSDYQYQSFYVNPSFIDVNSNLVGTTMTSIGRIGFQDAQNGTREQGIGFTFNDNSLLYEMGLIMGSSSTNILNNVRGVNGTFDQDFTSTGKITQISPGGRTFSEVYGQFSNSATPANQSVTVDYRSLVMKEAPYDKFIIVEYKVKAITAQNNFYFGIFSDWDLTDSGANDAAGWDNNNKLGYIYPAISAAKPHAGVQLLTGPAAYYAIDNNGTLAGNPWGLYGATQGSFPDDKKFQTISALIGSGNERLQAGVLAADNGKGGDVSNVVSSGPYNIAAGQTITIAFALHAAENLSELQTSARYADSLYNYTFQAARPAADTLRTCYNSPATLNVTGATSYNWYKAATGGTSFASGSQYVTGNLKNDTVFYVSNADHSYESVRTPVVTIVKANPTISKSRSPILCQGDTIKLSVASADSTIWSTGQKVNTIKVSTAGKYAVRTKDLALGCSTKSDTVVVIVYPKPVAGFSIAGDLFTNSPINFTDESTGATTWFWDFGDGKNSADQNPSHQFSKMQSYNVKLTATSAQGCVNSKTIPVAVVTGIDEVIANAINMYPNPVKAQGLKVVLDYDNLTKAGVTVTNTLGQIIFSQDLSTTDTHAEVTVPSSTMTDGLYIVKVVIGNKTVTRKVVRAQ